MTDIVLQKLESAFLMGCTDREACLCADIAPSTLYLYCEQHPEFSERKETLKDNPTLLAKGVQLEKLKEGDSAVAQKVIDRKEGAKLTLEGGEKPLTLNFIGVANGPG